MATSKTLAPTNVTIQIPAMTDQPDASVFSNCVDKEADAINALNSNKATLVKTVIQPGASASFTFSAYATYLVCFCGYNPTVRGLLVGTASNSVANLYDSIGSPTGVEITNSGLTMTFKNNDQYALPVRIFALEGTITRV